MSYSDELRKHARLAILKSLEDAPKYTSNVSIVTNTVQRFGIAFTRDQVETEVGWLAEQGFVTSENHAGFVVVTATVRGVEISQGIAKHDGIQRPRPGS